MRIAADNGHTWLRDSQLWANCMDNALLRISHGVQAHTKFFAVFPQGRYLGARNLILDFQEVSGLDALRGYVMVLSGQVQFRVTKLAAGQPQAIKGLRAGNFM